MDTMTIFIIITFFISLGCGFFLIPQILRLCKTLNLYDRPNNRKVHKCAIPRLGGLCFMPSMFLATALALAAYFYVTGREVIILNSWSCYFAIGMMCIYMLGLLDDISELRPTVKFVVQIIAASLIPLSGLWINNLYGILGIYEIPFWVGAPLTVFLIVFIDNAINLIDGIDGLSASLSLIALMGFLLLFMSRAMMMYGMLIAGLMGVLVTYLYFNLFGKAEKNRKIFMGDSGSLTLGFILSFLVIESSMDQNTTLQLTNPLLTTLSLILVPMFDVIRVILVRMRDHLPIFGADKNHIHHKLMYAGLSQHKSLIVIIFFALSFIVVNNLLIDVISPTLIIVIDTVIYSLFHVIASIIIRRRNRRKKILESSQN